MGKKFDKSLLDASVAGSGSKKSFFCHELHPALDVGGGKVIYGGSCSHPGFNDGDIYIGLNFSMENTDRRFPWEPGEQISFPLDDQYPPNKSEYEQFKNLIVWTSGKIDAGSKVHVGCIGGHGRTGTFLAALVAYRAKLSPIDSNGEALLTIPDNDPIAYVRKHYCNRAVESNKQIDFLMKEYGCKKAKPSKAPVVWTGKSSIGSGAAYGFEDHYTGSNGYGTQQTLWGGRQNKKEFSVDTGTPIRGKVCIWSDAVRKAS